MKKPKETPLGWPSFPDTFEDLKKLRRRWLVDGFMFGLVGGLFVAVLILTILSSLGQK